MVIKVVLDANVLFPFSLRDTLLRAAEGGYLQVYWSQQILDEMRRNLEEKLERFTPEQGGRLVAAMTAAFPEAMVTGHEPLILTLRNQERDRHVAAAALRAGAPVIVTHNIKDFTELPAGIVARTPDEILLDLLSFDASGVTDMLRHQAAGHRRPSITFEQLLTGLGRLVPRFVAAVQRQLGGPYGPPELGI